MTLTPGSDTKPPITPAEEKRIARELSPPVAWPTLALAVVLPASYLAVAWLGWSRSAPPWLCTPVLAALSYAHYTLVHESVHGNLAPGYPRLQPLNTVVGWVGALDLGVNWPFLMRSHLLHHAHTNTERDPDIFVKGTLGQLVVKWLVGAPFALIPLFLLKYVAPARYGRIRGLLIGSEAIQASAVTLFTLGLLVIAIATHHVIDWLCLWFVPHRIAMLILNVLFQWLPHYPFDRAERYLNTRISLWPGGEFLSLQQNLHLIHHLWPSVPFYNYARLYRRLHPVLVAKGSRIEGLLVGSAKPDASV